MDLWHAVGENDQKMFQRIMEESVFRPLDSSDIYRAMDCAARKGYALYVQRLAPLASPVACANAYLQSASCGNLECLKSVVSYIPNDITLSLRAFKECANSSLLVGALVCFASDCDHAACLDLLAPHLSKDQANQMLAFIGGQCSVDILNVLLKYADPKHNDSKALQKAVLENAQHNIDVLYPISDPSAALKALQESIEPIRVPQDWMPLYERIESDRLKNVLNNELAASSVSVRTNKM